MRVTTTTAGSSDPHLQPGRERRGTLANLEWWPSWASTRGRCTRPAGDGGWRHHPRGGRVDQHCWKCLPERLARQRALLGNDLTNLLGADEDYRGLTVQCRTRLGTGRERSVWVACPTTHRPPSTSPMVPRRRSRWTSPRATRWALPPTPRRGEHQQQQRTGARAGVPCDQRRDGPGGEQPAGRNARTDLRGCTERCQSAGAGQDLAQHLSRFRRGRCD